MRPFKSAAEGFNWSTTAAIRCICAYSLVYRGVRAWLAKNRPDLLSLIGKELVAQRRFADADEVLEGGLERHPHHAELLEQHAFSAHNSGRYQEAIKRWERVREACPELAMAWSGLAANDRELGRIDQASTTIAAALQRFPDDLAVISEAARIADRRGAASEALLLWGRMLETQAVDPGWLQGYLNNLILLRRFDEAAIELHRALSRFPDHSGLLATRGMLAMALEDWDAAMSIWADYCRRFPDDKTGWELQGRTLAARQLAELENPAPVNAPVPVQRVEDEAIRALLLGFENIGDNCEFGLVQRRYGAEPLGLLRWNSVSPAALTAALAGRFEGMGESDNTELKLSVSGEYHLQDRRWGMWMHTFIFESQVDKEALLSKMCKRVTYLKGKFLADLEAAEKIFVFKSAKIRLDELRALHAEMRLYGPTSLMCVRPEHSVPLAASLSGKAGDLLAVDDGLYVGFISRLGSTQGHWDIAFDDWLSICRNAHAARPPADWRSRT